jgi:hypothetical protein
VPVASKETGSKVIKPLILEEDNRIEVVNRTIKRGGGKPRSPWVANVDSLWVRA